MSDIIKKYEEEMSDREIMNAKFPKTIDPLKNKLDEFIDDEVNQTITIFEEEYPELSEEFKKIQGEMYELFARKHMDYGLNNIALGGDLKNTADKKFSLTGLAIRLTDKISRLKNLLTNGKNYVKGEAMEDTFIDVANYGIIGLLVGRDKWKK
jgi:predicted nuclease with TOPRIM domain